jgi:hypothetical protein
MNPLLEHCSLIWKALVKWSLVKVPMTPYSFVRNSSKGKVRPDSSLFSTVEVK